MYIVVTLILAGQRGKSPFEQQLSLAQAHSSLIAAMFIKHCLIAFLTEEAQRGSYRGTMQVESWQPPISSVCKIKLQSIRTGPDWKFTNHDVNFHTEESDTANKLYENNNNNNIIVFCFRCQLYESYKMNVSKNATAVSRPVHKPQNDNCTELWEWEVLPKITIVHRIILFIAEGFGVQRHQHRGIW